MLDRPIACRRHRADQRIFIKRPPTLALAAPVAVAIAAAAVTVL